MWIGQLSFVTFFIASITPSAIADQNNDIAGDVSVEVDATGKVQRAAPVREMRGCFVPDTPITMADGSLRPIRDVQNGDIVLSWNESSGKAAPATVMGITSVKRRGLLDIALPGGRWLTATHDHPLWSHGRGSLVSGDPEATASIYQLGLPVHRINHTEFLQDADGKPVEVQPRLGSPPWSSNAKVRFLEGSSEQDVITLCLDRHHWFFAHGVRVHNKGCFVPGTQVTMGDGSRRPIEDVRPGDKVLSWQDSVGAVANATVMGLVDTSSDRLMDITIPSTGSRITSTLDHPFWSHLQKGLVSADPQTTTADYNLKAPVGMINSTEIFEDEFGRPLHGLHQHRKSHATSFLQGARQHRVITLCLDRHHWFFAGGIRVHNKGCFVPETPVTMWDGTRKPIGFVKPGDVVRSYNVPGEVVNATVMGLVNTWSDRLMDISLPGSSAHITATPDHPFWSHSQKNLVSMDPDATTADYNLAAPVTLMNATEVFEDEHGNPLHGLPQHRKPRSPSFLQGALRRHRVITLCLDRHHWFYAAGIRVHNKGGCFVPDTPVTMWDGARKPIGAVKPGDVVRSWDVKTGVNVAAPVVDIKRTKAHSLIDVHFPSTSRTVTSTPDHPYWSHGQLSLVSADPDVTRENYGLEAAVALLNATDLFEDENGRPIEGRMYRRASQSSLGHQLRMLNASYHPPTALLEEQGTDVMTLELGQFHWFYVEGVRVHNKGAGGSSEVSYCCCNNGYQWNGQQCVECKGVFADGKSSIASGAPMADGGMTADGAATANGTAAPVSAAVPDNVSLPWGAAYHPMKYDLDCVDNVYIQWSNFWFYCGPNMHKCYTPDWCCCNAGFGPGAGGRCEACTPGQPCDHDLALAGSNHWWSYCNWQDGNSHPCYLPLQNSGVSPHKFCCCMPHKKWNGKGCVDSAEPVWSHVIPGSEHWWVCNEWEGYYNCNPYGSTPTPMSLLSSLLSSLCMFCCCCAFCGLCACIKLKQQEGQNQSIASSYASKAQACKRDGHETRPQTCASMATRDSSYRQAWICDHCNREFRPGMYEPFYRCEQCSVDFCQDCKQQAAQEGSARPPAAGNFMGQLTGSQYASVPVQPGAEPLNQ